MALKNRHQYDPLILEATTEAEASASLLVSGGEDDGDAALLGKKASMLLLAPVTTPRRFSLPHFSLVSLVGRREQETQCKYL